MADDLHQFCNRLRIMHSLDLHEIEGFPPEQYGKFSANPYVFLIRSDDAMQAAIWAAILKRETRP